MSDRYPVIIIGGGQAGLSVSIQPIASLLPLAAIIRLKFHDWRNVDCAVEVCQTASRPHFELFEGDDRAGDVGT